MFITVEGIEGAGKSEGVSFIANWLKQHQIPLCVTREPGGTDIAESIRQLLLTKHEESMCIDTELLLMFAARAQHLDLVIKPALVANQWVVCDRFTDASYAYQGGGRGVESEKIATLEQWVQGDLRPDVTFLLDLPVELALERAKQRSTPDRFESEQISFFQQIRDTYLARANQEPDRFFVIDTSQALSQVQEELIQILERLIHS